MWPLSLDVRFVLFWDGFVPGFGEIFEAFVRHFHGQKPPFYASFCAKFSANFDNPKS